MIRQSEESEFFSRFDHQEEKTFFETGSPPITNSVENQLFPSKNFFTFIPTYSVLENHLGSEGNVYIWVDEIPNITFRLYGERHPEFDNYKFHVHSNKTLRCSNSSHCDKMDACTLGINNIETSNLSKHVVFVSWKVRKKHAYILFQYRHLVIKCEDFDCIPISKLVLEGSHTQKVKAKRNVIYQYFSQPQDKFVVDLPKEKPVLYISFCLECEANFTLMCLKSNSNSYVPIDNLSYVIFNNSIVTNGWAPVALDTSEYNVSCILRIHLQVLPNACLFSSFFWKLLLFEEYQETKDTGLLKKDTCFFKAVCENIIEKFEHCTNDLFDTKKELDQVQTNLTICETTTTSSLSTISSIDTTTATPDECKGCIVPIIITIVTTLISSTIVIILLYCFYLKDKIANQTENIHRVTITEQNDDLELIPRSATPEGQIS